MDQNEMLMCLIAFILGYLVSRHMSGNGFSVGAPVCQCRESGQKAVTIPAADYEEGCTPETVLYVSGAPMYDTCKLK